MHSVSPASLSDIPQLVGLLNLLFTQETDFAPDPARQERALRLILAQPEIGRIFCARVDGRVIGMVSLLFSISTVKGGRVAWLEDMVVQPEWRGRRVGESLLKHALERARACNCSRITLLTDETNAAAKRFYERAGFVRSQMVPFRLHFDLSAQKSGG
jgi:ribosomal protein S18 acetylase RimI-like enzyme